jgi:hypothetical protein
MFFFVIADSSSIWYYITFYNPDELKFAHMVHKVVIPTGIICSARISSWYHFRTIITFIFGRIDFALLKLLNNQVHS